MTFIALLLLKVTVLFGAAWLAAALLRANSAAVRHQVWMAAILSSLMLPLVGPVIGRATPKWYVRALEVPAAVHALPAASAAPLLVPRGRQPAARSSSKWSVLLWIWGAGAIAMLLRLLAALAQLYRAGSRARPIVADPAFRKMSVTVSSLGASPAVRVLASQNRLAMPLTWGVFRPKILLPSAAMDWPEDRLRLVLSHELAHVARYDWIWRICGELARSVYWFHPLAWLAAGLLREESERACDDRVLASGVPPVDYAEELVTLARALETPGRAWSAALAMARPSNFERRLIAMLNPSVNHRPSSARARVLTGAVSLCLLLPIATVTVPAQGLAGTYSGTVADPSGAVVLGATVTLANTANPPMKETAQTDAVGRFQFTNQPAGQYTLIVMAQGFQPKLEPVTLDAGQDTTRDVITLDLARAQFVARVSAPGTPRTPQLAPATRIRVGGMVQLLRLIQKATPEYPPIAQTAGIEGTVDLEAVIGKDGSVLDLHRAGGSADPDLVKAAMNAVRQWRYSPTLLNGDPVEVVTDVSVQFTLQQ